MKRGSFILIGLMAWLSPIFGQTTSEVASDATSAKIVTIQTSVGTMKAKLYEDDRHEILNETDRSQVYMDLYQWLSSLL